MRVRARLKARLKARSRVRKIERIRPDLLEALLSYAIDPLSCKVALLGIKNSSDLLKITKLYRKLF